jgi:hypothetical protein
LRQHSVDCFRSSAACRAARRRMNQAHRGTRPCQREPAHNVSCTELRGFERCFESIASCEKFRQRRRCDHPWSACSERD